MKLHQLLSATALLLGLGAIPSAIAQQRTPTQAELESIPNGVRIPKEPLRFESDTNFKVPEIRYDVEDGACPGDSRIEKIVRAHRKKYPGKPLMIRDPETGELGELKPFRDIKFNSDGTFSLVSGPIVLKDC